MKLYTKTGDNGMTSLCGGKRVSKDDIRVEAYGTVDELNAHIGVLKSLLLQSQISDNLKEGHTSQNMILSIDSFLEELQNELFVVGGALAKESSITSKLPSVSALVVQLEHQIDGLTAAIPAQHNFIYPGGNLMSAQCHVCRTVCRRAERRIITLSKVAQIPEEIFPFINRLSDYFFILSRYLNIKSDNSEKTWENACR